MSHRHSHLIHIIFAAVLVYSAALLFGCGTQSGEPRELNDEQEELVRFYLEMKDVGLTGDVQAFNEMRDSLTHYKVMTYFKNWHRVVDSAKVSSWSYYWPDVAGLPIVQDSTDGEWRRLVFKQDNLVDKDGREKALYPIILFRKNGDTWKVSNASRLKSYKTDLQGNPNSIEDFSYHAMYRIPPDFSDLEKKPSGDRNLATPPQKMDPSKIVQPGEK